MRPGDPDPQAGFTLLNELSESETEWLLTGGETRFCERDMVLVKEGCRIDYLYLILEGVFSVAVGGANGREIAKLGPGQIVGEMSFLEDRPASATVTALEGSQVICIPRDKLEAKMRFDTAFSAHMHRALGIVTSRRLRDALGQLGRWLESEPAAESEVLARWERIAHLTQQFKERVIDAGKTLERDGDASEDLTIELRTFSQRVNEAIGDDSPETVDARDELGARIQRELIALFLKAKTPAQLYHKPRAYPGDFRAMEMIVGGKPEGGNRLGTLLDDAFLQLPSITALRDSRGVIVEEFLQHFASGASQSLQIAAIGSAPSSELKQMFEGVAALEVEATVIEFDDEALLRVRANPPVSKPLRLEMETLVDLALGRHRAAVNGCDFVYAPVLGNSLSDRFFLGLLNYIHDCLEPGGWAAVGCFHPQNPDKAFLQHVLGWPIHHRTEAEVNSLFRRSKFRGACEGIRFEPQGTFFVATCSRGNDSED